MPFAISSFNLAKLLRCNIWSWITYWNLEPPPVYPSHPPQATNTYPSQPIYNPTTNPLPSYASTVPNYGGGGGGGTTVIIVS